MSDHDTRHPPEFPLLPTLSSAGQAREVQILEVLQRAAAARKRRRAAIRRGSTVALAILLGAALVRWASPPPHRAQSVVQHPPGTPLRPTNRPTLPTPPDPAPSVAARPDPRPVPVAIVTNHHLEMAPCDPPAHQGQSVGIPNVCLLSDDQLLAALAETGETYGLVRAAGRVEVVRNTP